jgi:ATP-binding cassette subfamily B protein
MLLKNRMELLAKLSRVSYSTHEQQKFQEELRFIGQNGHRNWQYWASIFQLAGAVVSAACAAIALAYFSWVALVVLVVATVPQLIVSRHVAKRWFATEEGLRGAEHRSGYLGGLFNRVESLGLVKLFRIEGFILDSVWELSSTNTRKRLRMSTIDVLFRLASALVLQGALLGILGVTFYLVITRNAAVSAAVLNPNVTVSIGLWTTMGGLCGAMLGSLTHAVGEIGSLAENRPYLQRRRALLETPEAQAGEERKSVKAETLRIELQDVGYKYPNSETWALRNVSLTFVSGERVALLGDNGSGKSTLFKILSGLYEPTEGRVLVNGQDLREVSLDEYYRMMGFLLQEQELLEALTVAQLVSGTKAIDAEILERVAAICAITGASKFVEKLPEGYNTMVGRWFGGAHFSGGERQRLALATVLYRCPLIALLDEPTSAIDFGGKKQIKKALRDLPARTGYIIAAHEPIILDLTTRVVVLEKGTVVSDAPWEIAAKETPYLDAMLSEYRTALRL